MVVVVVLVLVLVLVVVVTRLVVHGGSLSLQVVQRGGDVGVVDAQVQAELTTDLRSQPARHTKPVMYTCTQTSQ